MATLAKHKSKPIENEKLIHDTLNELLCDFKILYQNVRSYHWNIKGNNFFVLHEKFEGLYTNVAGYADEVAERLLYLQTTPLHTYQDYIDNTNLKVAKDLSDAETVVYKLLEDLETISNTIRSLIEVAGDNNDYVSEDMGIAYETAIDEARWMFRSYLGN